jgi:hypothetical protein
MLFDCEETVGGYGAGSCIKLCLYAGMPLRTHRAEGRAVCTLPSGIHPGGIHPGGAPPALVDPFSLYAPSRRAHHM